MWSLTYDTNEYTYKAKTDLQTKRTDLWFPRGRRDRGVKDWEFGLADLSYYLEDK